MGTMVKRCNRTLLHDVTEFVRRSAASRDVFSGGFAASNTIDDVCATSRTRMVSKVGTSFII